MRSEKAKQLKRAKYFTNLFVKHTVKIFFKGNIIVMLVITRRGALAKARTDDKNVPRAAGSTPG